MVGDGIKRGRVSNFRKRMLDVEKAQTGLARSGTGWVLEMSLLIRQ